MEFNMKKIKTKDGSFTLFSERYKETYGSMSGALEEAFKKFVEPSNLKDGFRILDVCFGLGYNSLAAINKAKNLKIIALENDKKVLKEIQKIDVNGYEKEYEIIKKVARDFCYDGENEIKLILGDALEKIKKLDGEFDVVFLDPFSPKKCPKLWSLDFLRDIRSKMKKDGVLTTYSCARVVRNNLMKAGFIVRDGPVVGRRGPSTIAFNK
jgi:tRNA U34 5-methylaminomethyl-2-thiouridine-forming methyltransferase MnmC